MSVGLWILAGGAILIFLLIVRKAWFGCHHQWEKECAIVELTGSRAGEAGVVVARSCPKCGSAEAWVEYLGGSKRIGLDLARCLIKDTQKDG